MNLVQINERLKDLPMQVIQQYANGMNPEVPPYLALGELQRREMAQKQMATAQGGQQGPQPSIKEQVEQRAGLMAAQSLQQQQMMQQMAQPRGPMPAPAGVPQPEAQPEMMARGGLASVPMRRSMFDYAGGGIVAFSGQDGSEVKSTKEKTEQEKKEESARLLQQIIKDNGGEVPAGLKAAYAGLDLISLPGRAVMGAANTGLVRPLRAMGVEVPYIPERMFMGDSGSMTPAYDELRRGEDIYAANQERDRNMRAVRNEGQNMRPTMANDPRLIGKTPPAETVAPSKPILTTPSPSPSSARPMAVKPSPVAGPQDAPQSGLQAAAQSNVSPYMKKLEDMIATAPTAPTEEGVIASMNKLTPAAMQEAAMQKRIDDQRARAEQERAAYEKSRPSGLDELIRMLGQAGQYKGLSGMGPAYTAIEQQKRAEDLAMERRQNELLTAIEGRDYEGAKEIFGARTKSFDTAKQLFGREKESAVKAAGDLAQVDQGRINNELRILSEEKLKRLDLASREADRRQQGAGLALKTEYLAKMAKSRLLAEQGNAPAAAKLAAEAADILMVSGQTPSSGNADRIRGLQTIINSMDTDPQDKAVAIRELMALTKSAQPSAGGAPKVMTQADVLATAKSSGKTPQQVIEAAKLRGYEIK